MNHVLNALHVGHITIKKLLSHFNFGTSENSHLIRFMQYKILFRLHGLFY
jgi:hypothetical protein